MSKVIRLFLCVRQEISKGLPWGIGSDDDHQWNQIIFEERGNGA